MRSSRKQFGIVLSVAAVLVLTSVSSASAVSTWVFNPVPPTDNTWLGHSEQFTANDGSLLTAYGFSYTNTPNVATDQGLAIDIQGGVGYLGVCTGSATASGTCSEGNGSLIENEGLDEYIQLELGSVDWALKTIVLNHVQNPAGPPPNGQDFWYLYGGNSSDLFSATLLASGSCCAAGIFSDPFSIIASNTFSTLSGTGHSTIAFNDNAELHLFKNYFIATDHGMANDSYGLVSFAGEAQLAPAPEPGTLLLMGSGLTGLGMAARRRWTRRG